MVNNHSESVHDPAVSQLKQCDQMLTLKLFKVA